VEIAGHAKPRSNLCFLRGPSGKVTARRLTVPLLGIPLPPVYSPPAHDQAAGRVRL